MMGVVAGSTSDLDHPPTVLESALHSQQTAMAVLLIAGINFAYTHGVDLGKYRMIVYALLLILMMILRPQGLFGVNEIWDYFGAWAKRLGWRKAGSP